MDSTLSGLLKPYNRAEVARKVGATRTRVSRWANDLCSPEVHELPALAKILRLEIGELATIVAEDTKRRIAAQVSPQGAAA